MERQRTIQDKLEMAREKASILRSTLLAVHEALAANINDGSEYADAIHGAVHLTQELIEELQAALETSVEEENALSR